MICSYYVNLLLSYLHTMLTPPVVHCSTDYDHVQPVKTIICYQHDHGCHICRPSRSFLSRTFQIICKQGPSISSRMKQSRESLKTTILVVLERAVLLLAHHRRATSLWIYGRASPLSCFPSPLNRRAQISFTSTIAARRLGSEHVRGCIAAAIPGGFCCCGNLSSRGGRTGNALRVTAAAGLLLPFLPGLFLGPVAITSYICICLMHNKDDLEPCCQYRKVMPAVAEQGRQNFA